MPHEGSPLDLADVVRRYRSGESIENLAAIGISKQGLYKRIKVAGVQVRSRREARLDTAKRQQPPWLNEAIRLYEAGATQQEIAVAVGRAASSICQAFKRHGVARRSPSEVARLKWSTMTAEQRAGQVSAAHAAARGRERTLDELERRSFKGQITGAGVTGEEASRWH